MRGTARRLQRITLGVALGYAVASAALFNAEAQHEGALSEPDSVIEIFERTQDPYETLDILAKRREAYIGNPAGTTTIYEFFDYNCGYCIRSYRLLTQLAEEYPELRVTVIESPALSEASYEAAVHTLQLGPADYMTAHKTLMTTSGRVSGETVREFAQQRGINLQPYNYDKSGNYPVELGPQMEELVLNLTIREALGFSGVPGFVHDGVAIAGYDPIKLEKIACNYFGPGSCSSYRVLLDDAEMAAESNQIQASRSFAEMAVLDLEHRRDPAAYNSVCWNGAKMRHAEVVMEACNRAVELAPDNMSYIDSRGLARALLGDIKGAIEDFETFIAANPNTKIAELRTEAVNILKSEQPAFSDEFLDSL